MTCFLADGTIADRAPRRRICNEEDAKSLSMLLAAIFAALAQFYTYALRIR